MRSHFIMSSAGAHVIYVLGSSGIYLTETQGDECRKKAELIRDCHHGSAPVAAFDSIVRKTTTARSSLDHRNRRLLRSRSRYQTAVQTPSR